MATEENQDGSEVLETTETEAEAVETTEVTESVEELKAQLEAERKAREETEGKNKQLFERIKKAETKPKAEVQEGSLTPKDYLALTRAGVTDEDFDEVVRVAKILGKPIAEALSDKTLKSILSERADERKTANATHTKGGARGTAKVSDEDVLSKAERGEAVDDMTAIFRARQQRILGKRK